jgi:hypothetical protein
MFCLDCCMPHLALCFHFIVSVTTAPSTTCHTGKSCTAAPNRSSHVACHYGHCNNCVVKTSPPVSAASAASTYDEWVRHCCRTTQRAVSQGATATQYHSGTNLAGARKIWSQTAPTKRPPTGVNQTTARSHPHATKEQKQTAHLLLPILPGTGEPFHRLETAPTGRCPDTSDASMRKLV